MASYRSQGYSLWPASSSQASTTALRGPQYLHILYGAPAYSSSSAICSMPRLCAKTAGSRVVWRSSRARRWSLRASMASCATLCIAPLLRCSWLCPSSLGRGGPLPLCYPTSPSSPSASSTRSSSSTNPSLATPPTAPRSAGASYPTSGNLEIYPKKEKQGLPVSLLLSACWLTNLC